MAKLVFLQRTQKEIEIFGGDVYFDIDGKNAGKLSHTNQIIEVTPGEHKIKMYKSHTFDTFIGLTESVITIGPDEQLMVKYSSPMMINQPGNMVISDYSEQKEEAMLRQRDYTINRDFVAEETQKKDANEKYKNGVKTVIIIAIIIGLIIGIYQAVILSSVW